MLHNSIDGTAMEKIGIPAEIQADKTFRGNLGYAVVL